MCRTGGRRCPGQSTPEGRAARNARRRAQYAARKGKSTPDGIGTGEGLLGAVVTPTGLSPEEAKAAESLYKKMTDQEKYATSSSGDNDNDANPHRLSNHSRASYGLSEEVGLNQLSTVMTGTIDYGKLDDDSYLYFGFKDTVSSPFHPHVASVIAESEKELAKVKLSPTELGVVKGYTDSDFGQINRALFHPEKLEGHEDGDATPEEIAAMFTEAGESAWRSAIARDEGDATKQSLREAVKELDAAIARGPKIQRRVYRGIGKPEIGIDGGWRADPAIAARVDKWVDENRSVGSVVQFDGYQSSSLSLSAATGFSRSIAGANPIVYEIVTPEGIAVESVTRNNNECEVILPRQARYAVVGVHKGVDLEAETAGNTKYTLIQLVAINSNNEILDGTNSDPLTEPFVIRE